MSINIASPNFLRLVHLDLKGAPPRMSFYEQVFPLFRQLGANGLLVEFEDTFPFYGELDVLPQQEAYSKDQVRQMLKLAEENQLEFIPLVQSFGHMEFVLKHERFIELREVSRYPNSICPQHSRTMPLLQLIIGQLLSLIPNARWLHLGADEVWQLGLCGKCSGHSKAQLFTEHVVALARWVRSSYPHLSLIIWDDMLRSVELDHLKESGLGSLVQPMVWHYHMADDFNLKKGLWDKYSAVFPSIWAASAFKGATAMTQILPPLRFHLSNHQAWLNVLEREGPRFLSRDGKGDGGVIGLALTGWQRFDHFTTLCELLPVALPSLALCLQALLDGEFTSEGHQKISKLLGFGPTPIDLNTFPRPQPLSPEPSFPGAQIYHLCHHLTNLIAEFHNLTHHPSVEGAFNEYLVSHNRTNPLHIDQFLPQARLLSVDLEAVNLQLREALSRVYSQPTVEEWCEVNVVPFVERARRLVAEGEQQAIYQACVVHKSADS